VLQLGTYGFALLSKVCKKDTRFLAREKEKKRERKIVCDLWNF
jgi:hypothetical protein